MAENKEKKLTIERAKWSPVSEKNISLALGTATLNDIKEQVKNGAYLFNVFNNDVVVCSFVLRVDNFSDRSEGVIVAAGGDCENIDLTMSVVPVIEKMFINCKTIRCHTARAGLTKKMERMGYSVQEIVLTKTLGE